MIHKTKPKEPKPRNTAVFRKPLVDSGKPTVILQGGWLCNGHSYSKMIDEFIAKGYPVLTIPLLGSLSRSMVSSNPRTFLKDNVDYAMRQIKELGLKNIILFAHSAGSQPALGLNELIQKTHNEITVHSIILSAPSLPSAIEAFPRTSLLNKVVTKAVKGLVKLILSGVDNNGDVKKYSLFLTKMTINLFSVLNKLLIMRASSEEKKIFADYWKDARNTPARDAALSLAGIIRNKESVIESLKYLPHWGSDGTNRPRPHITVIGYRYDTMADRNGDLILHKYDSNLRIVKTTFPYASHFGHEVYSDEIFEIRYILPK